MNKFKNIAICGGGSFGTSLACLAARNNKNVTLFMRDEKIVDEILHNKTNTKYLGDIKLPHHLQAATTLDNIKDFELIIIAVPSYGFDDTIKLLRTYISTDNILLITTKGFANNPTELFSDRLKTLLPNNPVAFLSGPNLAKELASNLPASATIASLDIDLANKIAYNLTSEFFITSAVSDIITLQVAAGLKNIFAIRSGIDMAKGQGENARATLMISALKEIALLSQALGGTPDADILLEAGVLGDLILTCYSSKSRNTKFGYEFGVSNNKGKFLEEYKELVEGREALKLVLELIKKYNLNMPIVSSLANILYVIPASAGMT
ncbi:MAG TPA: NAD(P)H-dependent glycerol-3-phosphate dehydrogenase [Rickettsia endosymbiont of Pyrocoelia pectoralis]|nr:NAD(P)H-dependent glycerol-3-phosphate dehydrogenase [Rickettsia endosymbiont of Pyrocoelia pectoralis]